MNGWHWLYLKNMQGVPMYNTQAFMDRTVPNKHREWVAIFAFNAEYYNHNFNQSLIGYLSRVPAEGRA